eukprot:6204694-Pleurochrysis_carterae.AAC.6
MTLTDAQELSPLDSATSFLHPGKPFLSIVNLLSKGIHCTGFQASFSSTSVRHCMLKCFAEHQPVRSQTWSRILNQDCSALNGAWCCLEVDGSVNGYQGCSKVWLAEHRSLSVTAARSPSSLILHSDTEFGCSKRYLRWECGLVVVLCSIVSQT